MHWMLYLIILLAMLAGWLYASAAGLSVNWFGLVLVPDLIAKNTAIAPLFRELHHALVALLVLVLIAHIGAALRHALVLRDDVMQRMLPLARRN
jgi:cytochrome b561